MDRMSRFEEYLQNIGNRITINDADREVYTRDFDVIRDYILGNMCRMDRVFNLIYKGPSLFGSYSNNVRINHPDEFDVIFKLSVPFSSLIQVEQDQNRPGFVCLDFEDVMLQLEDIQGYNELYDRLDSLVDTDNNFLRRSNLQRWLEQLILNVMDEYGNQVRGRGGDLYTLQYSKRGLAHTIFARNCRYRNMKISIDFIPALVFGQEEWMDIRPHRLFMSKQDRWYAIPKPNRFGPKGSRKYSFMICNPKAEHDLLLCKQNLKVVFRLLKSLRNEYKMPRLKSYFLTTAFLWEIETQKQSFWSNPISHILVHMLDVLSDYFSEGYLPFFWDRNLNLLDVLDDDEIDDYDTKLMNAYNTLSTYNHQRNLTLGRCLSHFEILK